MKNLYSSLFVALLLFPACKPEIGDECSFDADCSANLDRNCDRNQPGGYCLIIGCEPDECPGEAVCVEYITPCPDGTEDEKCLLIEPNRTRTYCLKHCKKDSNCRSDYICADPLNEDLNLFASIIDLSPEGNKICIPSTL